MPRMYGSPLLNVVVYGERVLWGYCVFEVAVLVYVDGDEMLWILLGPGSALLLFLVMENDCDRCFLVSS